MNASFEIEKDPDPARGMRGAIDLENVIKNLEGQEEIDRPYAGLIIRGIAQAIDALFYAYFFWMIIFVAGQTMRETVNPAEIESIVATWYGTFYMAFSVFYLFGFPILFQATPGKMVFNCRIVDEDTGEKAGFFRIIIREIVLALCLGVGSIGIFMMSVSFMAGGGLSLFALLLSAPLIGVLMIPFNECKQGLHDKMARTVVVRC